MDKIHDSPSGVAQISRRPHEDIFLCLASRIVVELIKKTSMTRGPYVIDPVVSGGVDPYDDRDTSFWDFPPPLGQITMCLPTELKFPTFSGCGCAAYDRVNVTPSSVASLMRWSDLEQESLS